MLFFAVVLVSCFLVGLVLISQAITALYISHIHAETQNRPLYIVDKNNSLNIKKYGGGDKSI